MDITPQQVLAAITGGATLSTAIFWGAYHLGMYRIRLDRVEAKVEEHDKIITVFRGGGV